MTKANATPQPWIPEPDATRIAIEEAFQNVLGVPIDAQKYEEKAWELYKIRAEKATKNNSKTALQLKEELQKTSKLCKQLSYHIAEISPQARAIMEQQYREYQKARPRKFDLDHFVCEIADIWGAATRAQVKLETQITRIPAEAPKNDQVKEVADPETKWRDEVCDMLTMDFSMLKGKPPGRLNEKHKVEQSKGGKPKNVLAEEYYKLFEKILPIMKIRGYRTKNKGDDAANPDHLARQAVARFYEKNSDLAYGGKGRKRRS
jgi:hypothetical protein